MFSELTLLFEIIPLCVIKSLNGLCECLNREMDWQENRPVVQLMDLGERTDKSTREWGEMRGVRWAERLCFCQIWEWRRERERTTITSTLTPPVIMGSVSDAMIGRKEEGSDSNRWENMGHNDKNLVWGLAFQSRGEKWGGAGGGSKQILFLRLWKPVTFEVTAPTIKTGINTAAIFKYWILSSILYLRLILWLLEFWHRFCDVTKIIQEKTFDKDSHFSK